MNRTRIDWAEYSWNPVTGCAQGCDYCYARRIAERFHGPDGFKPTFHPERLSDPLVYEKPKRIFVCSMADLFGDWVPDEWINQVLAACEAAPQHQYLFLTKNPQRYEELFLWQKKVAPHPNWWLGATFDTANDTSTYRDHLWPLHESGWHTWASAEPLLEDITENMEWEDTIDWLVIGAQTGPGSKNRQPKTAWVESLVDTAVAHGIPVFLKQSLKQIIPEDLVQWYPKGLQTKLSEKELETLENEVKTKAMTKETL